MLVTVDIGKVIEEARRAARAWNYLGGCWGGRIHALDLEGKQVVPGRDDRKDVGVLERMETGERKTLSRADHYRRGFQVNWDRLKLSKTRLIALLNGGNTDVLDCDHEALNSLGTMWVAVAAIPTEPPEFRLEGNQDFYGNLSCLLGWMADELERLRTPPATAVESNRSPPGQDTPETILRGWREICSALGGKSTESQKFRYLAESVDGCPIRFGTKGELPQVVKSDLLGWWNNTVIPSVRDKANRERDAMATVQSTYKHGRSEVVPDISGHVKGSKKVR